MAVGVVVGDDEAPGTEDGAVISQLETVYTVVPLDDDDVEVTTGLEGIIIPGWTASAAKLAGKYVNGPIPVVYGLRTLATNAGMGASANVAGQDGVDVQVSHDALGALGLGVTVMWTGGFAVGTLTEATLPAGTVLLGYNNAGAGDSGGIGVVAAVMDAGGAMDGGGTANARKGFCGLFINGARYTAPCDQFLLDMVAWTIAGGGGPSGHGLLLAMRRNHLVRVK